MTSFRGGANIPYSWARLSATWPFATLAVDPDALTLNVLRRVTTFGRRDIASIELAGSLWTWGIAIVATDGEEYFFWSGVTPRSQRRLIDCLTRESWTVEPTWRSTSSIRFGRRA